jgi:Stabilization of polarity axis
MVSAMCERAHVRACACITQLALTLESRKSRCAPFTRLPCIVRRARRTDNCTCPRRSLPRTRQVQAAVPLHSCPDETLTPSVTLLFTVFGTAAMRIYNAVITGQRVLFVGYNHAAGDVGKLALAACAMVAPPLRGIVRRTFPYANLSDLTFLETAGYVAGVRAVTPALCVVAAHVCTPLQRCGHGYSGTLCSDL